MSEEEIDKLADAIMAKMVANEEFCKNLVQAFMTTTIDYGQGIEGSWRGI